MKRERKLTPFQVEMIRSGHPDLNHAEVGRLYNVTKVYVCQLRNGKRGIKGLRSEGKPRGRGTVALRTANEFKFKADFLSHAVPLLRSTLRAEQEMRRSGVFHTAIEAEKRERRWRHAQTEEPRDDRPGEAGEVAAVMQPVQPAFVPQARQRKDGQAGEGFLFDTRRLG